MWKGRFKECTGELVQNFTESIDVDKHFYQQDITCSKIHVQMLAKQKIIEQAEAETIIFGLNQIQEEIEKGEFEWRKELEDVHMNIENRLVELIGSVGKKLHTGRSRNDQVAIDFRLYVSEKLSFWQKNLLELIHSLLEQTKRHRDTILPGYTHFQPAQPVSLAHHLLAYIQMLKRDYQRIEESQKRIRISPLGAAALGGTTYPIDPEYVAKELGFEGIFSNSLDAVSDRDFVLEAIFIGGMIMTHLSRLGEELIIWANPNFGFISLPDEFATGSSIMPQKKNPDVAELVRGKTGKVYGNLMAMFSLMKALPLAYNRDLQEDKPPFLDTDKIISQSLLVLAAMFKNLKFNSKRMKQAIRLGYLNATEFADYLVRKGLSFREAHYQAGQAVAYAEGKSCGLEDLSLEELKTFSPLVQEDVWEVLDYEDAINRRKGPGSTGYESVQKQVYDLENWLEKKEAGGSV